MTKPFPQTLDFSDHNAPSRVECDIYDLLVEGTVPAEINGSWFRSIPDPQFPPMLDDDTFLSGDGMVSVFRFENGHVDFRMRAPAEYSLCGFCEHQATANRVAEAPTPRRQLTSKLLSAFDDRSAGRARSTTPFSAFTSKDWACDFQASR